MAQDPVRPFGNVMMAVLNDSQIRAANRRGFHPQQRLTAFNFGILDNPGSNMLTALVNDGFNSKLPPFPD